MADEKKMKGLPITLIMLLSLVGAGLLAMVLMFVGVF